MFIDDIKNRYTYLNSMKNLVHRRSLGGPNTQTVSLPYTLRFPQCWIG